MASETVKDAFKKAEEAYKEATKDYDAKGVAYVPWSIFKTARLYLHNKGILCKCSLVLVEEHYQIAVINGYIGQKYIGTAILLPEDTEGKAYGKADKCILDKVKEV